jgi:hypothetical protein
LDPKAFEDEGTTSLKYQEALTRDTVSHPRGPDSSATLLWKPDLERTFNYKWKDRQIWPPYKALSWLQLLVFLA